MMRHDYGDGEPSKALPILERYIARLRADIGDPNYPGPRHQIPADLEHAELRARALRKEIAEADTPQAKQSPVLDSDVRTVCLSDES